MAGLDWASAGASVIGNIFGGFSQNHAINKQIAAQKEENERTREYNLQLARMQNAWNIEQWNRENAYNSPEGLKARGLNPNLAMGTPAASSPTLTSGAPASSADMSNMAAKQTVLGVLGSGSAIAAQQLLQNKYLEAQIDKTKAEADKVDADANGKQLENYLLKHTMGNQITLSALSIDLNQEQLRVLQTQGVKNTAESDAIYKQIEATNKQMEKLDTDIAYIKQQTANLSQQERALIRDNLFKDKTFNAELDRVYLENKQLFESIHLTQEQARGQMANTALAQYGLVDQLATQSDRRSILSWNAQTSKVQFNLSNESLKQAEIDTSVKDNTKYTRMVGDNISNIASPIADVASKLVDSYVKFTGGPVREVVSTLTESTTLFNSKGKVTGSSIHEMSKREQR